MLLNELYDKYLNIVPMSIQNVPKGQMVSCGRDDKITSLGAICIIKCMNADFSPVCTKTRIINIQELGIVTKCKQCLRAEHNLKRRVRYHRQVTVR